jgi:hypothetical protein
MPALADDFARGCDFYGAILAVVGTHVPIEAPVTVPERYVNRKGAHSVVFQVAVDSKSTIRNVYDTFPGSCHDAYVFRRSILCQYVEHQIPTPFFIIGDAAYPEMTALKRPFKGRLTEEQMAFNYKLSAQRMVVERTFGFIKKRFKRFRYSAKNGDNLNFAKMFMLLAHFIT